MGGFYVGSKKEELMLYTDKFYEALDGTNFSQDHSYKYLQAFFGQMLPTAIIEDRHIVKVMQIKQSTPDTLGAYTNQLQDMLEKLLRCKRVRDKARED